MMVDLPNGHLPFFNEGMRSKQVLLLLKHYSGLKISLNVVDFDLVHILFGLLPLVQMQQFPKP